MAKTRAEKEKILEELSQIINESQGIAIFDYQGLSSEEVFELRRKLAETNNFLKVVKISLLKLALKRNKVDLDFKRPIAIAYSKEDEVLPFKVVFNFLKKIEKGTLLSGFLGKEYLDKNRASQIAEMPTKRDLQAQVVSVARAPVYNFLFVLKANEFSLINLLNSYKSKLVKEF
jgi:large subunit ribosomal protein L10